jgi:hypothetical protein
MVQNWLSGIDSHVRARDEQLTDSKKKLPHAIVCMVMIGWWYVAVVVALFSICTFT